MKNKFLNISFEVSKLSKCQEKRGAIIVKDNTIISTGWDEIPTKLNFNFNIDNQNIKKYFDKCQIVVKECPECAFNFYHYFECESEKVDKYKYYNCPNCNKTLSIFDENKKIYSGYVQKIIENPNLIRAPINAIINAINLGINLEGSEIFLTHKPCYESTKHIILMRIKKIYYGIDLNNENNLLKQISIEKI